MALFLTENDVAQLLTMPLALEAVEAAHRALAVGQALDVPRQRTRLPQTTLHVLQGALPEFGVIGYKAYTSNRSGVRFLVHLYDASTGSLRAVIEADRLGMMRTAAASHRRSLWRRDALPGADGGARARNVWRRLAGGRPSRGDRRGTRARPRQGLFA